MTNDLRPIDRRRFLDALLGGVTLAGIGMTRASAEPLPKLAPGARLPRVAAINSIYRLRSHAYHIAGRFIFGYTRNGFHHQPPFQLVRMFNHQYPPDDLSRSVCP